MSTRLQLLMAWQLSMVAHCPWRALHPSRSCCHLQHQLWASAASAAESTQRLSTQTDYEQDIIDAWRISEETVSCMPLSLSRHTLKACILRARCTHIDNLLRIDTTRSHMSNLTEAIQLSLMLLDKLIDRHVPKTVADVHVYGWITYTIAIKFLSPRVSCILPRLSTLPRFIHKSHLRKVEHQDCTLRQMEKNALWALEFDITIHTPDVWFQWWCNQNLSISPLLKSAISYVTWIMLILSIGTRPSHVLRVAIEVVYQLLGERQQPHLATLHMIIPESVLHETTQILLYALQKPPIELYQIYSTTECYKVSLLISQRLLCHTNNTSQLYYTPYSPLSPNIKYPITNDTPLSPPITLTNTTPPSEPPLLSSSSSSSFELPSSSSSSTTTITTATTSFTDSCLQPPLTNTMENPSHCTQLNYQHSTQNRVIRQRQSYLRPYQEVVSARTNKMRHRQSIRLTVAT